MHDALQSANKTISATSQSFFLQTARSVCLSLPRTVQNGLTDCDAVGGGGQTNVCPKNHEFRGGAHGRHLANTVE